LQRPNGINRVSHTLTRVRRCCTFQDTHGKIFLLLLKRKAFPISNSCTAIRQQNSHF
jgi:hypothetical protein